MLKLVRMIQKLKNDKNRDNSLLFQTAQINLGGYISSATVLVSPDVSELMLGITWLTRERVVWDFSARTLLVGQKSFPLQSKKSSGICPRVCRP